MEEFLLFFMSVFILFMIVNKINHNSKITSIKSEIDGRYYSVRRLQDAKEAANKLAKINQNVLQLISTLDRNRKGVNKLIHNYNPSSLTETVKDAKYTSYSVNKGEKIAICIRDIDDNFMDENTILFVVIHELSHVMTEEIGHPPIFWDNMKYLLEEAEKINIYKPIDYSRFPQNYCGMEINTTPYVF